MDDRRYHYLSLEYEVFDIVDLLFSYTLIDAFAFTFECWYGSLWGSIWTDKCQEQT